MPDTFQLEIVTPEKKVVDTAAEEVQIPGKNGYLGVLPGHAPLITELAVGEITYCENSQESRLAVAWGFAEVLPDKVTILAETAERAEDIDARRAQEAKQRAESNLATSNTEEQFHRVAGDLKRADTRLEVAARKKKITPAGGAGPVCGGLRRRFRCRTAGSPRARSRGRQRLRRQRMDADQFGPGAHDDGPGLGHVLWRSGSEKECAQHHDAKLRHDGHHYGVW